MQSNSEPGGIVANLFLHTRSLHTWKCPQITIGNNQSNSSIGTKLSKARSLNY